MEDILELGRPASYVTGEILLRPSDPGDTVFYIESGMVHVYAIEQSGSKNIQIIWGVGDFFPATWIANPRPLNLFYEALTDCSVIKIHRPEFEQMLQENARASFKILKQVASQFLLYKANVDNLEYRYARERVAYRLLLIARKFGKPNGTGMIIHRLSQDELANSTNVSRESVNRELRRFERLGHITYGPGKQMTIDPAALRRELAPEDSPLLLDDV